MMYLKRATTVLILVSGLTLTLTSCASFDTKSKEVDKHKKIILTESQPKGVKRIWEQEKILAAITICGMGVVDSKGVRTRLEKEVLSNSEMTPDQKILGYKAYTDCIERLSLEEGIFQ